MFVSDVTVSLSVIVWVVVLVSLWYWHSDYSVKRVAESCWCLLFFIVWEASIAAILFYCHYLSERRCHCSLTLMPYASHSDIDTFSQIRDLLFHSLFLLIGNLGPARLAKEESIAVETFRWFSLFKINRIYRHSIGLSASCGHCNHVISVTSHESPVMPQCQAFHGKCLEIQRCSAGTNGSSELSRLAVANCHSLHKQPFFKADWTIERARVSFLDMLLLVCYFCYIHHWSLTTGSILESSTKCGSFSLVT